MTREYFNYNFLKYVHKPYVLSPSPLSLTEVDLFYACQFKIVFAIFMQIIRMQIFT